ncbi:Conserved membrane protein of uncharacterised function [Mycobacteroides abscessus subsp. abscessus]|uniref:hypothetical protein n=1 Tax=Mycobacteriaceae TaxID=1762 RepID=UPI00092B0DF1|nr:hypothetical protein [Mycobacteroides abscessus]SHX16019.1 Conserved membrane protein of uncharacterised function [Mycobacteroides abscessus subsp. abscessus]SIB18601.1 Conserved membrane protein of uncharacterised function [Mycobacteroides abscessus subsp. abscessus]SIB95703.1 Conserved membrane protein of uncharacterised function [Mycobacteroides abscessus subsp. abscessus]SIC49486.1 Conserved membrane protein of uncharacterised function [Mycobacteroides abscessus subsp. abscessus]SIC5470
MPGIAELAMGAAPIAGGVLLGAVAGNVKGPDIRAGIIADFDLLDRIPAEQTDRRAAMSQMIGQRIDTLVEAGERSRQLRNAAASYQGNWRDIVVFVCAVLFTIVWWHVNHHRSNWLPMFVMLIVLSVITGIYAVRGVGRVLTQLSRRTGSTSRHLAP